MEVRMNNHGSNSLSTKVFFSDEKGFEVASVIVMGKTDAVLMPSGHYQMPIESSRK
jgi:hypothetical protein